MRTNWNTRALTLLALPALLFTAANAQAPTYRLSTSSKLWVEGTSTVRSFRCEATKIDGQIQADASLTGLQQLEKAVSAVEIKVPTRALACGNSTMDGHMYKALKAEAAPTIRFKLASHSVAPAAQSAKVTMKGDLTIAGKTQPITLEGTATPEPGGAVRVKGTEMIKMTEYGVKPPTLMMGTMKVGDEVKVGFDVLLNP